MKNKFFHDQLRDEEYYGFFHKHWFYLVSPVSRLIIAICILVLAISVNLEIRENIPLNLFQFVALVIFLIALYETHRFFLALLSWFLTVVILTDLRLVEVVKSIYTQDEKESIDLKKIQDIQMRKVGFLRNFLDFGRIHLTLATISDSKEIKQVPHVSEWAKTINRVRLKAISVKKTYFTEDASMKELREKMEREISDFINKNN